MAYKKYTAKFVRGEVLKLYNELMDSADIIYLGQLFLDKPYSRQRFSEWAEEFKENPHISDTIKRIKEILETRVVTGGMLGAFNPTMTIFHLKNNYDWKDKQEYDHTSKGDKLGVIVLPQKNEDTLEATGKTGASLIED
jgi:hypothetical protein